MVTNLRHSASIRRINAEKRKELLKGNQHAANEELSECHVVKETQQAGSTHGLAKLSETDVIKIRYLATLTKRIPTAKDHTVFEEIPMFTMGHIAEAFGIAGDTVAKIVRNIFWKSVPSLNANGMTQDDVRAAFKRAEEQFKAKKKATLDRKRAEAAGKTKRPNRRKPIIDEEQLRSDFQKLWIDNGEFFSRKDVYRLLAAKHRGLSWRHVKDLIENPLVEVKVKVQP